MATTGILKGELMRVLMGATPAKIGHTTSSGLSIQMATIETSSKDTGGGDWTESAAGKLSGTANVEFLFNLDDSISSESRLTYEDLFDAQLARTVQPFKFSTGVSGDTEYSFNALITGLDGTFANDENATATATITVVGAISKATIA